MIKYCTTLLFALIFLVSCVEKPEDIAPIDNPEEAAEVGFPSGFNFETEKTVDIDIIDSEKGIAAYQLSYEFEGNVFDLGTYVKTNSGFETILSLPHSIQNLSLVKQTPKGTAAYEISIRGNHAYLDIGSVSSSVANQSNIGLIYAINNSAELFSVDPNNNFEKGNVIKLAGGTPGGSMGPEENTLYYYNGINLRSYNLLTGEHKLVFRENAFGNSSVGRMTYKDGYFWISNWYDMYKVNAYTNEAVAYFRLNLPRGHHGGGDLAFDNEGTLYITSWAGLYKAIEVSEQDSVAVFEKATNDDFKYVLSGIVIDDENRIFVSTMDSNIIEVFPDGTHELKGNYGTSIHDLAMFTVSGDNGNGPDSDNDGVPDVLDEYPEDPDAATNSYEPSVNGKGSYAFEDFWPKKGDYDFNDMVVEYQYQKILNAENKAICLEMDITLKAIGAGYRNGFGIELEVDKTQVASVTGTGVFGSLISHNANGLESNQDKAVVIVFNDTGDHMRPFSGEEFVNTNDGEQYVEPVTFNVIIEFTEPIDPNEIGSAPYNPFIFSSGDRSKEIHLAGLPPTTLADKSLFGTGDDDSNTGTGKYYQDENNMPWAIHMMYEFKYPQERNHIDQAYNRFNDWGLSGGNSFSDWYGEKSGYRNSSRIYFR